MVYGIETTNRILKIDHFVFKVTGIRIILRLPMHENSLDSFLISLQPFVQFC